LLEEELGHLTLHFPDGQDVMQLTLTTEGPCVTDTPVAKARKKKKKSEVRPAVFEQSCPEYPQGTRVVRIPTDHKLCVEVPNGKSVVLTSPIAPYFVANMHKSVAVGDLPKELTTSSAPEGFWKRNWNLAVHEVNKTTPVYSHSDWKTLVAGWNGKTAIQMYPLQVSTHIKKVTVRTETPLEVDDDEPQLDYGSPDQTTSPVTSTAVHTSVEEVETQRWGGYKDVTSAFMGGYACFARNPAAQGPQALKQ
jgi:hypothetical protein